MSILDAVAKLLEETGHPLHYKEIANQILARSLANINGQTPWDSVNARLAVDIKSRGIDSRFARFQPGVYGLRAWETTLGEGQAPTPPATDEGETTATMSFTNAAEYVLKNFGNSQPMHYQAITAKALQLGLIKTGGLTPEATMYSSILAENQRRRNRGEAPRFAQLGEGWVGLTSAQPVGLAHEIERHNQEVRNQLLAQLRELAPTAFESLMGQLLGAMGFDEVQVTRYTNDGGIDVRGVLVISDVIRLRLAVQAKKLQANVQRPVVQMLRGSLRPREQGVIITTSDFSAGARAEANLQDVSPIWMINGKTLVSLLIEHGIGVKRQSQELLEMGEW